MPENKDQIKVHVTFPLTTKQPFKRDLDFSTNLAVVLEDVKQYFGAVTDGQTQFHFNHDGRPQTPEATVGQLAGSARAIELVLIKDMVAG